MSNFEYSKIDGVLFERMIHAGASNLAKNVDEVNNLNVFPVPDGDTGENMYLTLKGGIEELNSSNCLSLGEKSEALARGMLLGARGNSGVILSQLFSGLAEGLLGLEDAGIHKLLEAMTQGVKMAYHAVSKPVEGTILTVARESVENTRKKINGDTNLKDGVLSVLEEMKISLANTPMLLEALKEAGVIDSGGAGLVYIFEGFYKALVGETEDLDINVNDNKKNVDFSKFLEDSVMEFGYCTELLVRLQNSKVDVENFDVNSVIEFLEDIGDSVVAFKNGSILKIHVHTLYPYKVLEYCQKYGEYLTTKIENMTLQHNETIKEEKIVKQDVVKKKHALVTVASGDGLIELFKEMGADYVVTGGQTNNPSANDFIEAFDAVNAENIYVLPNNGNILLTAKQAANIYKNSNIYVINTKNIGQGYMALSMVDYGFEDVNDIVNNLSDSIVDVKTIMLSKAVRTTTIDGIDIIKDNYMGFSDHKMFASNQDKIATILETIQKIDLDNMNFIIAIYGSGASLDEKIKFSNYVKDNYPFIEYLEIEGKQDVYDFILVMQ